MKIVFGIRTISLPLRPYWFSRCHPARGIKGNRVQIPNRTRCCKLQATVRTILLPLSAKARREGVRTEASQKTCHTSNRPYSRGLRDGHLRIYLLYCEKHREWGQLRDVASFHVAMMPGTNGSRLDRSA